MMLRNYIYVLFFSFITVSLSAQEICNNDIDDDGDGLIDCFDPDCSASPDCPAFELGSICSPTGGSRADIIEVQTAYSGPGGAPTFTIPAGATRALVYISSHDGISSPSNENQERADEDVAQINAIIDLEAETSSGFLTYIRSTLASGDDANLYGWNDVALGNYVYASAPNDNLKGPIINDVRFIKTSPTTFRIDQTNTRIRSSFMVEFTSPTDSSLIAIGYENRALFKGSAAANRELVIPIPARAELFYIYMFATNATNNNSSNGGTEEGYAKARFFFDLTKNEKSGYATVANGAFLEYRSTYSINNIDADNTDDLTVHAIGDFASKNTILDGGKGLYNPKIYVSGGNLYITRDAPYAADFDDVYVVDFFERIPEPMSAEFIETQNRVIPKGQGSFAGTSRTFDIPAGAEFVYFKQEASGINSTNTHNENALSSYIVIDLIAETYSGQYWQQVGFEGSGDSRRDDNFAFKNVPLTGVSAKGHVNTVGKVHQAWNASETYDINFSLSADKNTLTVTNKTGIVANQYFYIMSADFFGRRPDVSANIGNITFSKGSTCKSIVASVELCNPGAGRSPNGMPVSFYDKDPTADDRAKLLYTGTVETLTLDVGQCEVFDYEIDMSAYTDLNIDLTIILNDDASYAAGIGNEIGTVFALQDLANQGTRYVECDYSNNISTTTVNVNNCPKADLDTDQPGDDRTIGYCNSGSVVSLTGTVGIEDLDHANIHGAEIILSPRPDGASEFLAVTGVLSGGITSSGYNSGTGILTLSGVTTIANYEAALALITYTNNAAPYNTTARTVTFSLFDGVEYGPLSTSTVTMDAVPSITLLPLPSYCNEVVNVELEYSSLNFSPNQYEINFDAAAEAAGFVDVGITNIPSSPITFPLPAMLASGTYNAEIRVRNSASSCIGVFQPFTIVSAAICANDDNVGLVGIAGSTNIGNILTNDALNGVTNFAPSLANITIPVAPPAGNPIVINTTTGQIDISPNAQAGIYTLTYQICEVAIPANCATAEVIVEIDRALIVSSVDCQCIDDAPYLVYNVTPNFPTTSHLFIDFMDPSNRNVLKTDRVEQNYTGQILYPGAEVDGDGKGINWPGWELTPDGWDGPKAFNFGQLNPQSLVRLRINPEAEFLVDYPPATPLCATEPTSFLLPVTWLSFNGRTENSSVQLSWSTASELNNNYFEVQRSIDGISFESIGFVEGMGTVNTQSNYSFTDEKPFSGYSYYRLKQVDYDGEFEYSKIIVLSFMGSTQNLVKVFPNPTSGIITIDAGENELGNIIITDAVGKIVYQKIHFEKVTQFSLASLGNGIYFLRLSNDSVTKIVKQ